MAREQKIILTFDDEGNVTIKGEGFIGKQCDEAMADLEEKLGLEGERENLDEYDEEVHDNQNVGSGDWASG